MLGVVFSEVGSARQGGDMLETMNTKLRYLIFTTVLLGAALPTFAITQAEWAENPSLIPTPSASSAFYVTGTEPIAPTGEQTVSTATMQKVDLTPVVRRSSNFFSTILRTVFTGLMLFVR